jgi:hypothetical protein
MPESVVVHHSPSFRSQYNGASQPCAPAVFQPSESQSGALA